MLFFLWTLLSLIAYAAGLVLVTMVTARLLKHSFDEGWFMGLAALDVLGGILAFGAVAVTLGIFSGSFAIKVFDFLLLLGILIVGIRMAYRSFLAPKRSGAAKVSQMLAGGYCLLLLLASLYCMWLLLVPSQ